MEIERGRLEALWSALGTGKSALLGAPSGDTAGKSGTAIVSVNVRFDPLPGSSEVNATACHDFRLSTTDQAVLTEQKRESQSLICIPLSTIFQSSGKRTNSPSTEVKYY